MSDLVGNPEDRFSHDSALILVPVPKPYPVVREKKVPYPVHIPVPKPVLVERKGK